MYLEFFDLKQAPFSITPDPEFVYLSEKHQESLAHLIYGVTRGGGAGFVQLTGEVGTGKTTISRLFLQKLPEDTQAALILNPNITPDELLENIFKELKISTRGIKGKLNAMVDKLNTQLLSWWSAGKNTLVIIDEAQNIPRDTLEQLRLLTNLETDQQKLLQIILIGQPELKQLMQRKDLRQLSQRITSRFHLQPLSKEETIHYIQHRLTVSGGEKDLFTHQAMLKIFQQTGGIPRLINVLCDRALLVAFVAETKQVKSKQVKTAITELYPDQEKPRRTYAFTALAAVLFFAVFSWQYFNPKTSDNQPVSSDTPVITNPNTVDIKYPSKAVSWQQFLSLWGESDGFVWSKNACPEVSMIGMACMLKQGNLNKVKQMNVPVLLQLRDGNLVLLKAIKNGALVLATTAGDISISEAELNSRWFGHYFILWPLAVELIDGTIDSSTATWALDMAHVIDNNPNLGPQDLNQWITEFQQANGLLADGIIGKETQMALSLMAYQGPKLTE